MQNRMTGGDSVAAAQWASERAESVDEFASRISSELWDESLCVAREIRDTARESVPRGLRIGGGGHLALLYFLTRLHQPNYVVETGVAAGYSSLAFLRAIEANGSGTLASSDFPYFRLNDPERLVGMLVPVEMRTNWRLEVRGDDRNLPLILADIPRIDLFHYDSDKSYAGRRRVSALIEPKLATDAVFLMDDIGDDFFFRDFVDQHNVAFRVFRKDDSKYYVGMICF
jgi:predicted O-methyltransferase YrrM